MPCASAALSEAGACPLARAGQARTPANNAYMLQQLHFQQQRNALLMAQPQAQPQAQPAGPAPLPQLQMAPYNPNQGRGRGRGGRGRGRGGRGGNQGPCYGCGGPHLMNACPFRGV